MAEVTILFNEEIQFVGYSDSNLQGPIVKFRLQDAEHLGLFRGMTAAKAGQSGQLMRLMLMTVDADPFAVPAPTEAPKPKLGALCLEALDLCRNPAFRDYVGGGSPDNPRGATEAEAREHVLQRCGIESRKELDTNTDAQRLFMGLRHEYLRWVRENRG